MDSDLFARTWSGAEWAPPARRLHLPYDGGRQLASTVLQNNTLPSVEALEGSLLDVLMTQFTEVDFTVGNDRSVERGGDESRRCYQIDDNADTFSGRARVCRNPVDSTKVAANFSMS